MQNELLFFLMFFVDFGLLLLLYRLFGRIGIYAWIPAATILANIQVMKTVVIFGMTATLGNAAYASIFLATDILSENYGKKEARIAVWLGLAASLAATLVMSIAVWFVPAENDFAHESLKGLFTVMPRVAMASLIAYLISQFNDISLYHLLKKAKPSVGFLWMRNNGSTLVSQLLDSLIFATFAFWGMFPLKDFISIVVTTYLFKALGALLDTPCIYVAAQWFVKGKIRD